MIVNRQLKARQDNILVSKIRSHCALIQSFGEKLFWCFFGKVSMFYRNFFDLYFHINCLHLTMILVSPITGHVIGTGGTKVVDIPVRPGIG